MWRLFMRILYNILLIVLLFVLTGCATIDKVKEWKNFPTGLKFDDLDNLYEKYFDKAERDEGGWVRDTVEKVNFEGKHSEGIFTVEVKDMKPGPGTGKNGTTGSGNKAERFFLRFKSKGYDKALDIYTMHKGRNGVRARVKSEDGTISIHIGGFITHGDRVDPHVWKIKWDDNKVWIWAAGELCNGDNKLPWTIGNTNISFKPEAVYIGGGGDRPFEGAWRHPKFIKGGE